MKIIIILIMIFASLEDEKEEDNLYYVYRWRKINMSKENINRRI